LNFHICYWMKIIMK